MAITSRQDLVEYCLRNLGAPVIEINVDTEQIEDRIDEALKYFHEYHFDGIERTYLKHIITPNHLKLSSNDADLFQRGEKVTGQTSGASLEVYDTKDGNRIRSKIFEGTFLPGETVVGQTSGASATISTSSGIFIGDIQNEYIEVSDAVINIDRVLPIQGNHNNTSMFDITYQIRLNDLYNVSSTSMLYYTVVQQHLALIDFTLNVHNNVHFSRKTNKVFIQTDWRRNMSPDSLVIFECYRILDPNDFPKVYDDMFLKKYATALIKRQWGTNLKKFGGLSLPGGVTLNGKEIYDEAVNEIQSLEDKMQEYYSMPPQAIYLG